MQRQVLINVLIKITYSEEICRWLSPKSAESPVCLRGRVEQLALEMYTEQHRAAVCHTG